MVVSVKLQHINAAATTLRLPSMLGQSYYLVTHHGGNEPGSLARVNVARIGRTDPVPLGEILPRNLSKLHAISRGSADYLNILGTIFRT